MRPLDASLPEAGPDLLDTGSDAADSSIEAPTDARADASADATPDVAPTLSCDPLGRDVSLSVDVPLPWAADRDGMILTASIVPAFHAGRHELYVSEPLLRQISVVRGCDPYCEVSVLSAGLNAPLRATPVDFDGDGDRDIVVADIGLVQARVDLVGRVVLLLNEGARGYRPRVLLDGVGRVTCAEPADLDGDGDLDLTLCEFGAKDGSVGWLERTPQGSFARHELRREAGAIHAYPFDADADGDLDIAVALSQRAQQVLLYRNRGAGQFDEEIIYRAQDERFGLTGIELADLDGDGDQDLLVAAGDYLDDTFDLAQHGLYLLDNDGAGHFSARKLAAAPGLHAVKAIDMDRDCDTDLVLAQLIVPGYLPDAMKSLPSLQWLENDGHNQFEAQAIAGAPEQTAALAALALDGTPTLFTGSFSIVPATSRQERLVRLRVKP
jgi:hypothetical protein